MKATRTAKRITSDTKHRIEWVPLGSLIVDPTVQRPLDEKRAQKLADRLDLNILGLIHVSARPNGVHHVIDGQHRVAALRLVGFDGVDLVQCTVEYDLDKPNESRMFNGDNTAANPRAYDRFRVRLADPDDKIAQGIDSILMKHGWRLLTGLSQGAFTAVVAAESVYTGRATSDPDRGPANLDSAIGVVTEAWGHEPQATHGALIAGLGLFFARYGAEVDKAALVRRLAGFPGGPDSYVGKARGIREFRGGTLNRCVAELTVEVYNRRRSSGSLPEWRS